MNNVRNDLRDEVRDQTVAMLRHPKRHLVAWLFLIALTTGGCAVMDAVLDGVYGGVSDTVSGIVTGALLGE
jgi:hypothetical protein